MKLLEKLKNTFFEEEYIEVEEEEPAVAKKVEPKEIKREIKREEKKIFPIAEEKKEEGITSLEEEKEKSVDVIEEKNIENYSDSNLIRKDSKLPYFEEEDFVESNTVSLSKEEPKKIYGESPEKFYHEYDYKNSTPNHPYGATQKEAFRPTPIISPIYGILDKNYRKEEVVDKKDIRPSSYASRKNADLDSVRRKAYGGVDPIEEMRKPFKEKIIEKEEEENLLYDMTTDHSKPVVNQVTLQDAEEYFNDLGLEYNIDYKDNRYEKATGRRTSTPVKEEKVESGEDANLEDNLFDLIDSYYEGGEE